MKTCTTVSELIDAAGPLAFAKALWPESKWPYRRADDARARGALGLATWGRAVKLAERHGLSLDYETLARWHRNASRRQWDRLKS